MHYPKDVTQKEDASRIRTSPLVQLYAQARNFALNLYVKFMFLKKAAPNLQQDDKTVCSVLLSPLPAHTSQEALNLLNQLGAKHVEEISLGFISAEVKKNVLPQLEEIARVEVKRPYQMR